VENILSVINPLVGVLIGGCISYFVTRQGVKVQDQLVDKRARRMLKIQLTSSLQAINNNDNIIIRGDSWIFENQWVGTISSITSLTTDDFMKISLWFSKLQRVKWAIEHNMNHTEYDGIRPMYARECGEFSQNDYDSMQRIIDKL